MTKQERCVLASCDRPIQHKAAKLCKTCYSRITKQLKRGPSWLRKRSNTLAIWAEGVDSALDMPRPSRKKRSKSQ